MLAFRASAGIETSRISKTIEKHDLSSMFEPIMLRQPTGSLARENGKDTGKTYYQGM